MSKLFSRIRIGLGFLFVMTVPFVTGWGQSVANVQGLVVRAVQPNRLLLRFAGPPPVQKGQVIQLFPDGATSALPATILNLRGESLLVELANPVSGILVGSNLGVRYTIAAPTLQIDGKQLTDGEPEPLQDKAADSSTQEEPWVYLSAGPGLGYMRHAPEAKESLQLAIKIAVQPTTVGSIGLSFYQGTYFNKGKRFLTTRLGPELRLSPWGDWKLSPFAYVGYPLLIDSVDRQSLTTRNQAIATPGPLADRQFIYGLGATYRVSRAFGLRADVGSDHLWVAATLLF